MTAYQLMFIFGRINIALSEEADKLKEDGEHLAYVEVSNPILKVMGHFANLRRLSEPMALQGKDGSPFLIVGYWYDTPVALNYNLKANQMVMVVE